MAAVNTFVGTHMQGSLAGNVLKYSFAYQMMIQRGRERQEAKAGAAKP